MLAYIVRRILHAMLVILLVSVAVFLLIRALPGDPIEMLVHSTVITDAPQEVIDYYRHLYGLDQPLVIQYVRWLFDILRGDFGRSILHRYEVREEILRRLPLTMTLGFTAFIIGIIVGPTLGVICAIRRGKLIDNIVAFIANIGITAPQFWVGIMLMYVFALKLNVLPLYGFTLPWVDLGWSIRQGILPIFVIALFPIASSSRQMRSSVIEILQEDYVRTAWAKGLNERKVLVKHIIKNSIMPVVTLQGMLLRNIVGGSVVVETVFVIPGMGSMLINSIVSRDYVITQGVMLVLVTVVVIANLFVDLLYGWLDPRIQYE